MLTMYLPDQLVQDVNYVSTRSTCTGCLLSIYQMNQIYLYRMLTMYLPDLPVQDVNYVSTRSTCTGCLGLWPLLDAPVKKQPWHRS